MGYCIDAQKVLMTTPEPRTPRTAQTTLQVKPLASVLAVSNDTIYLVVVMGVDSRREDSVALASRRFQRRRLVAATPLPPRLSPLWLLVGLCLCLPMLWLPRDGERRLVHLWHVAAVLAAMGCCSATSQRRMIRSSCDACGLPPRTRLIIAWRARSRSRSRRTKRRPGRRRGRSDGVF